MALAMGQQLGVAQKDFSMDLLLIGDNGPAINNWDWIDKPAQDSPIQGLLRQEVDTLEKGDCKFMILDGGMSSVFLPKSGNREIDYFYRDSATVPTLVESWQSHGITHTKKSRYAKLTTGGSGGYNTAFGINGYQETINLYLNVGTSQFLQFNDLTSLHNLLHATPGQAPAPDQRILVSPKSISDTIQDLGPEVDSGVCFCEWGFVDPAHPNVVSYPPAGMVAHYKFSRTNGKLGLTFVEYLGSRTLTY